MSASASQTESIENNSAGVAPILISERSISGSSLSPVASETRRSVSGMRSTSRASRRTGTTRRSARRSGNVAPAAAGALLLSSPRSNRAASMGDSSGSILLSSPRGDTDASLSSFESEARSLSDSEPLQSEESLPRSARDTRTYTSEEPVSLQGEQYDQDPATEAYEFLLASRGFIPVSKVLAEHEGQTKLYYIKTVLDSGEMAYVVPDLPGETQMSDDEPVLVVSQAPNNISTSAKSAALKCVGDTCDVVFECGTDGICLVTTDKVTKKPIESNLASAHDVSLSEDALPYPVVRMTEIVANDAAARAFVAKSALSLRRSAGLDHVSELAEMDKNLRTVSAAFSHFRKCYEKTFRATIQSARQLAAMRLAHLEKPCASSAEKVRDIIFNLSVRNQMLYRLFALNKHLEMENAHMRNLAALLNSEAAGLEEQYKTADYVYTRD